MDLSRVRGAGDGRDGGVACGARLVAFTDAAMGDDEEALRAERQALRRALSDAAFVDACATIGAFNVVDRVADATGIPLDEVMWARSAGVRETLELHRFASAANTPT